MEQLKKLAKEFNYRQYRHEISKLEREYLKEKGIVIVFGASDDLIEFDGAIYDEAGCYDGGKVWLDNEGNIYQDDMPINKEGMKYINIIWCDKNTDYCWRYETDIPHEKFMVYEDDEPYGEGFLFYKEVLKD